MRRTTSSRAAANGRAFACLAVGAMAGLVGWIWWANRSPSGAQSISARSRPAIATAQPIAAQPGSPTNLPVPITFRTQGAALPLVPVQTNAAPALPASPTNLSQKAVPILTNELRRPSIDSTNTSAERCRKLLEAQVALAQRAISAGSVDGVMGAQTHAALRMFQRKEGLAATGQLDDVTQSRLTLKAPLLTTYPVTDADLARLRPLARTWLGKSLQSRLEYETILELVAEKSRTHPNLIRRLNPEINWTTVAAGTEVKVPNTEYPPVPAKAAFAEIHLADRVLQVFDTNNNLLGFFPCSIAQQVEKRPVGELHVAVVAPNPNYTFNPKVFPESAEARELDRKLILQPGPNNPVGAVWIGLDRPGYGIHGTPQPEQVGRTESHGCFRLANWNAEYLLQLAWVGMPVFVLP